MGRVVFCHVRLSAPQAASHINMHVKACKSTYYLGDYKYMTPCNIYDTLNLILTVNKVQRLN